MLLFPSFSYPQNLCHMQQVFVQLLLAAVDHHLQQRGGERVGRQADHDPLGAREQQLYRLHAETAPEQAVEDRRRAPPLIVPQHGYAGLEADGVLDAVGNILRMSGPLRHDDQGVGSPLVITLPQLVAHLTKIQLHLRHDGELGPRGDRGGRSEIAGVAPHDFNDKGPVVRTCRVLDTVHGIQDVVECGVNPQRHVGIGDVIIDAGMPMTGKPILSSARAPFNEPSPPITISPSTLASSRLASAFLRPSSVRNSGERADCRKVPPRCIVPETAWVFKTMKSFLRRPAYPLRYPIISMSLAMAVRAAARMVAFMPEQSPPLVKIASRLKVDLPYSWGLRSLPVKHR